MPSPHFETTHDRKSVLWRNSTYRQDTSDGFRDATGAWESHHICCNHAVEGREINENKEYVEECLWITDWDLNNSGNLTGLPKNRQYRNSLGTNPVNLCSHQVDHNTSSGYTFECKQWLKINVWNKLNDKKKQHEVNAVDLKAQLEQCTSVFKAKLTARGARKGGTLLCWKNRFDPAWTDTWYHPFSMGMFPRPRRPGISSTDLTNIFKLIA